MYFSQEVHQAFSSMLAGEVDGSPAETPLRPYLLCKTNALILLGKMGLEAILCSWVWGKEKKLYSWGQGRHSIQPSPGLEEGQDHCEATPPAPGAQLAHG